VWAPRLGLREEVGSRAFGQHGEPPFALFVCQDETHRDKFLAAADRDLTGRLWHASVDPSPNHHPGRLQPCSPANPTRTPACSKHTGCRPSHQATQAAKAHTPKPVAYGCQD
jgi:hypothetical protein